MSHLGEINRYFSGLEFKRYQLHPDYTIYICNVRTYEQSSKEKYVLVYVMNPDARYDYATIQQLRWFAIKLTDDEMVKTRVPQFNFLRSTKDGTASKERILHIAKRDYHKSIYAVQSTPVSITIQHNPEEHSTLQYPDQLSFHLACNEFKTLIKRTDF